MDDSDDVCPVRFSKWTSHEYLQWCPVRWATSSSDWPATEPGTRASMARLARILLSRGVSEENTGDENSSWPNLIPQFKVAEPLKVSLISRKVFLLVVRNRSRIDQVRLSTIASIQFQLEPIDEQFLYFASGVMTGAMGTQGLSESVGMMSKLKKLTFFNLGDLWWWSHPKKLKQKHKFYLSSIRCNSG